MDSTTAAIVTAAAAAFGKGILGEAAKDAYKKVKGWLARKFATASEALGGVEAKPESTARQDVAGEELTHPDVTDDGELADLIAALQSTMQEDPAGKTVIQAFGQQAIAAGEIGTVIQGNVTGNVSNQ